MAPKSGLNNLGSRLLVLLKFYCSENVSPPQCLPQMWSREFNAVIRSSWRTEPGADRLTNWHGFFALANRIWDALWTSDHCVSVFLFLNRSFKNFMFLISSVAQSCPTLCDPMNCSTPGLPVHHELPESTQSQVHWVSDAIQPSHPLSSPSPPAFDLSQHQGSYQMSQLFISGGQNIGVSAPTSVLPMNTQDWSPLEWTGWISLQSKGLSRVFSNTTVQKHQFFSAQLSL